ncbi:MAG: DNA methyltransferase [Thermoplasmata archaeon]
MPSDSRRTIKKSQSGNVSFNTPSIKDRFIEFQKIIDKIHALLASKISNKVDFEAVVCKGEELQSHLSMDFKSKPEPFTKENIIEEFLDFLGFTKQFRGMETELKEAFGRKYPDYKLIASPEFYILLEAEPLNTDLKKVGSGIEQVVEWITNKACTTEYGIASDGFRWVLIEYSLEYRKHRIIKQVDISNFFKEKFGQTTFLSDTKKLKIVDDFIAFFSKEYIQKTIEKEELDREVYQEEISKKFYDDYIALVFGNEKTKTCLVNSVNGVADKEAQKKIAHIVVDRFIFIKFIEAKGWLNNDTAFLKNLLKTYKENPTGSFYDSYLKVLFFNVLNNPNETAKKGIFTGIKYLNGGLFRKILEEEKNSEYSINDDILEKIIEFLERYAFGDEHPAELLEEEHYTKNFMSPEILGYIFERTANHEGGAYYTPANVTAFMTNGTVHALICDIVNQKLEAVNVPAIKRIESLFVNCALSKDELKSIYQSIKNLKILDPACGSGAFFMPAIGLLTKVHKLFLMELEMPFDEYKVKKWIIENNIYGVELKSQAAEIAKLRLWLELVSAVKNMNEIDILPSIEYNIISGNSLLGFDEKVKMNGIEDYVSLDIDDWVDMLSVHHSNVAERIKELSENPSVNNLVIIKDILVKTYKSETEPKIAAYLKKVIEKVHVKLQSKMNQHYLTFINPAGKKEKDGAFAEADLQNFQTLHWILEFDEIINKGGFDVIIGNPPYVEHSKIAYPLEHFATKHCGNIYAPFFEKAIKLSKEGGYFSYIVPISSICTDRMIPLQKLLIENTHTLKISNFDDRPDKIFKGLEDCRSSIIFGLKNKGNNAKVYSTNYFRWCASERDKLFKNVKFIEVSKLVEEGYIPKIGTKMEVSILEKIRKNAKLQVSLTDKSKDRIVYHNAPRYWIRAMNFMPEFSNDRGSRVSAQNKEIYVNGELGAKHEIVATINSSLFYWFFIVHSDCRHLNLREIEAFPFEITKMKAHLRTKLIKICQELMEDYKKNSKLKDTTYKTTGRVVYREFYPKESKSIIDKIDDVLGEHYGFSEEEKEYIKNFDLKFRMGNSSE